METSKDKGSNITYDWIIELGSKNYTYNNTDGKLDFTPTAVGKYEPFFWKPSARKSHSFRIVNK